MTDRECVEFLQWALPRMGLRWRGFRRVRRQVCKRIARRHRELELSGLAAYRGWLEQHPEEWHHLDFLCAVTISRFWRDAAVFDRLGREVLPALAERAVARGDDSLRCWSAGCASGEEPYSLALAWKLLAGERFPDLAFDVVATDASPAMIQRAREARYPASSLKDLLPEWAERAFRREGDTYRLRDACRPSVDFRVQDLRTAMPDGPFDVVLCRNLVFTYLEEPLQRRLLDEIRARVVPAGALVLGSHESLPGGTGGWTPWPDAPCVFARAPAHELPLRARS